MGFVCLPLHSGKWQSRSWISVVWSLPLIWCPLEYTTAGVTLARIMGRQVFGKLHRERSVLEIMKTCWELWQRRWDNSPGREHKLIWLVLRHLLLGKMSDLDTSETGPSSSRQSPPWRTKSSTSRNWALPSSSLWDKWENEGWGMALATCYWVIDIDWFWSLLRKASNLQHMLNIVHFECILEQNWPSFILWSRAQQSTQISTYVLNVLQHSRGKKGLCSLICPTKIYSMISICQALCKTPKTTRAYCQKTQTTIGKQSSRQLFSIMIQCGCAWL